MGQRGISQWNSMSLQDGLLVRSVKASYEGGKRPLFEISEWNECGSLKKGILLPRDTREVCS